MGAATQVVAIASGVAPLASFPGLRRVHPAHVASGAVAQVAGEVVAVAAVPSGASTAVLPVIEARPIPSSALEADAAVETVDTRPFGVAVEAS